MENNEMIVREEDMETTEQDYATETYYEERQGIPVKDAIGVAMGTVALIGIAKWVAKKTKPLFVKWCVNVAKKNGHTVVPNELLDNYEEDSVDESEEIVEDED